MLPPWFGESGEGRQGKWANLGEEKCGKIIGGPIMRGVGMDAISETIVRHRGVVNGEGGVLYILSWRVP